MWAHIQLIRDMIIIEYQLCNMDEAAYIFVVGTVPVVT